MSQDTKTPQAPTAPSRRDALKAVAGGSALAISSLGVTAAQAAASIFPRFDAGSGVRDVRGGVNIIYRLSPHWFLAADTSVTRLLGDAARSPISISDTNVMTIGMIGYRF